MYRKALPLTGFDEECRAHVAENMRLRGINIYSETSPTKCVCLERWALLPFHHSRSFRVFATVHWMVPRMISLDCRRGLMLSLTGNEAFCTCWSAFFDASLLARSTGPD